MDPELEFNGKTYRQIGGEWYDANTFIRAPLAVAQQLDHLLRASAAKSTPSPKASSKAITRSDDESTFRHAETFPIIADIIHTHCRRTADFITHKEIVQGFLAHPEGRILALEATKQQEKPLGRVASNIVAWFSKRFTEGATPYQDQFERKRVDRRWAYRSS